jgi:type II secretory pathway component HofQ
MRFYDKYPQLKEKRFLTQVLTDTVFSTMSLESQQVPLPKVEEIVLSLLKERESEEGHFFSDQGR